MVLIKISVVYVKFEDEALNEFMAFPSAPPLHLVSLFAVKLKNLEYINMVQIFIHT